MPGTYSRLLYHVVFATKYRQPTLVPTVRDRLFPYIVALGEAKGIKVIEVGGVENHIHLLLSIPPRIAVSKAVQVLKGNTSRWLHDTFGWDEFHCWQEGYGAFSVGSAQVGRTVRYIQNQEAHHRSEAFEDEYVRFLEANGVQYDDKYVFD